MNCHMSPFNPVKPRWTNQSTEPVGPRANELPTEALLANRWPRGQRFRPRIGRKYIRVLTRLTTVGNAACTFDIVTRPENWPTANLRHVSATCAQYGVGPTLVGMLLANGFAAGHQRGERPPPTLESCKTSGLSGHVEPYFQHFTHFKHHFPRGTLPS